MMLRRVGMMKRLNIPAWRMSGLRGLSTVIDKQQMTTNHVTGYGNDTAVSYAQNRAPYGCIEMERMIRNWTHGLHYNSELDDIHKSTDSDVYDLKILDAGCGIGTHIKHLGAQFSKCKFTGIDISNDMIKKATELQEQANQNSFDFKTADIRQLPFDDKSFDVVIVSQCLHHLSNPASSDIDINININYNIREEYSQAIEECYRVLSENGLLIIVYTNMKQRKHSYWHFNIFPTTVWDKLINNDRWSCFEYTDKYPFTLTNRVINCGFECNDMIVPETSHWYQNIEDQILSVATNKEKNREWKLTEGCFNYMNNDEINQFDHNLQQVVSDSGNLSHFINKINANRRFYGEGTVQSFKKISDEQRRTIYQKNHNFDEWSCTRGNYYYKEYGTTTATKTREMKSVNKLHPFFYASAPDKANIYSGDTTPSGMLVEKMGDIDEPDDCDINFGAILGNIDLSNKDCIAEMKEALFKHKFLVIPRREACYKPYTHLYIANIFGDIEDYHPINPKHYLEKELQLLPTCGTSNIGPDSFMWHTDMTWRETPSQCGLLLGMIIPPYDGDTCVLNTNYLYNILDQDIKDMLLKMRGVHDLELGYERVNRPNVREQTSGKQFKKSSYTADHPCVIAHPVTGLPHLFVNRNFTDYIYAPEDSGLDIREKECQELLDYVLNIVDDKKVNKSIDFKWQEAEVGSMIIWDNIATQHMAKDNYDQHFRLMHRAVVLGYNVPQPYQAN